MKSQGTSSQGRPSAELTSALRSLFLWAEQTNFRGNDPHDLLESPLLEKLKHPMARLIALQLGRRSAFDLRQILKVPRQENPKGIALFLSGLAVARELVLPDWKEHAESLGERLLDSMHGEGGWGYPFSWQSRTHYIPKGTPNIVTTAFVGFALQDLYAISPSSAVLEAIKRSADYIVRDIPRAESPAGIAFGYAKADAQIVFNASLLGAEFLLRTGILIANEDYQELARRAAWFVVKHQRVDGGWVYGLEPSQTWIDSFHTGYVIVSLRTIGSLLGDEMIMKAAMRGFEYYCSTFIEPDHAIRYYSNKRYPIDAHAVGQALITLSLFGDLKSAEGVARWAFKHLRSKRGFYYYQVHRLFTNRLPYLRWSNAWMFRGLAELARTERNNEMRDIAP